MARRVLRSGGRGYLMALASVALLLAVVAPGAINVAGADGGEGSSAAVAQPNITTAEGHTCVVLPDGIAQCWGSNAEGRSGNADPTSTTPIPFQVGSISTAVGISANSYHSCAVLADGSVQCWGNSNYGRSGHAGINTPTPITVVGVADAIQVSAGKYNGCALIAGGTVKCWGRNNKLQSGHSGADTHVPITVAGLSGAIAVSAGRYHTCALIDDGTVKCWGDNPYAQLGRPGAASATPMDAVGITSAVSISVGKYHSCAVLADGSVQCWGRNDDKQTGSDDMFTTVPTTVTGVSGAIAASAGSDHSCAVIDDGSVTCWGGNTYSQSGYVGNSPAPAPVAGVASAVAISAGTDYTCAVTVAGAVLCWGENDVYQLGSTSTTQSAVPLTVAGLTIFLDADGDGVPDSEDECPAVANPCPTSTPIPTSTPSPTVGPSPSPTPTVHVPSGSVDSYAIANLEELEPGPNEIRIHGWSYDPDLPSKDLVVHVYAFFDGVGDPVALDTPVVRAADFRPDINRAFGIEGDHGFNRTLAIRPGNHRVCVYSLSVDGAAELDGLNELIGCRYVTVTNEAPPRGAFDQVAQAGTVMNVSGWAYDLDRENQSVDIQVYLDGVFHLTIPADTSRPDVNKIVQIAGDHGFDSTFSVPSGSHQVCLYVIGVDPTGVADGENVLLNVIDKPDCRTTTG